MILGLVAVVLALCLCAQSARATECDAGGLCAQPDSADSADVAELADFAAQLAHCRALSDADCAPPCTLAQAKGSIQIPSLLPSTQTHTQHTHLHTIHTLTYKYYKHEQVLRFATERLPCRGCAPMRV